MGNFYAREREGRKSEEEDAEDTDRGRTVRRLALALKRECSSPLPRCHVLSQQGFPIILAKVAIDSLSYNYEGRERIFEVQLPRRCVRFGRPQIAMCQKKPRKESDDVRVLSHARNDAVGCGGGGGRVMFVVVVVDAVRQR